VSLYHNKLQCTIIIIIIIIIITTTYCYHAIITITITIVIIMIMITITMLSLPETSERIKAKVTDAICEFFGLKRVDIA